MKKESIEDELKFMKTDFISLQKDMHEKNSYLMKLIDEMKEHIAYLYCKQELKIPQRKTCKECSGTGTFYISPISDCGQPNSCPSCYGMGFKYV